MVPGTPTLAWLACFLIALVDERFKSYGLKIKDERLKI